MLIRYNMFEMLAILEIVKKWYKYIFLEKLPNNLS